MDKKQKKKELLNKGNSTIREFKQFISKGNVIDLAVGVIIGSAFGKIVSSMVNDILMPLIGIIIGGLNFSSLHVKIGEATIQYGSFIQNVIDFLIVAACIFLFIKIISKFNKKKDKVEEVKQDEQIVLLTEIRDLLKEKKTPKTKKKNS